MYLNFFCYSNLQTTLGFAFDLQPIKYILQVGYFSCIFSNLLITIKTVLNVAFERHFIDKSIIFKLIKYITRCPHVYVAA